MQNISEIQVGYTFTSPSDGSHVTVTEIPGKIKGFRGTSSIHDGREVLWTARQMARDTGLAL